VAALLRAVEVMDQLRSPGGCPWDAAQTHESLARYLLEETYETLEAIETGDPALLREELGDLLLQVLFHARLAEELSSDERFSIEDVAGDLVAKLVRRHPHVFTPGDGPGLDAEQVNASWEELKAQEKGRRSVTDGVPPGQPALAYAEKLMSRARRDGLMVELPPAGTDPAADIGARLFALVGEALEAGVEPETALRRVTWAYRDAILAAEGEQAP
jgi:XTP/dITP diphosphohydrolase